MESAVKSMETIKARVTEVEELHFIQIDVSESEKVTIPLSEDKPNEIKGAFNHLIKRLKTGVFEIELEGSSQDLFFQVSKEYISQLNRELYEVYGEMESCGLTVPAS